MFYSTHNRHIYEYILHNKIKILVIFELNLALILKDDILFNIQIKYILSIKIVEYKFSVIFFFCFLFCLFCQEDNGKDNVHRLLMIMILIRLICSRNLEKFSSILDAHLRNWAFPSLANVMNKWRIYIFQWIRVVILFCECTVTTIYRILLIFLEYFAKIFRNLKMLQIYKKEYFANTVQYVSNNSKHFIQ